jgi:hypothetical protein
MASGLISGRQERGEKREGTINDSTLNLRYRIIDS